MDSCTFLQGQSNNIVPSASEIVAAARRYKGTPFRHQGRSHRGLDCLGLLAVAFRDAGLTVMDRTDYPREPDVRRLRSALDDQLDHVPKAHGLGAGIVALFFDRLWLHVGLMTDERHFIHSRGPEDIGPGVVEHILDVKAWEPRLVRIWRHPEMEW